jgi:hypothetical protein
MPEACLISEHRCLYNPGKMIHEFLNKWGSHIQHSQFPKSPACVGGGGTAV